VSTEDRVSYLRQELKKKNHPKRQKALEQELLFLTKGRKYNWDHEHKVFEAAVQEGVEDLFGAKKKVDHED
jgi:hypothetical protein